MHATHLPDLAIGYDFQGLLRMGGFFGLYTRFFYYRLGKGHGRTKPEKTKNNARINNIIL
jgi:hypothetical protein